MGIITVGIDIGPKVDPTAIAVSEVQLRPRADEDPGGYTDDHHIIRHLERLQLGTPYPKVADRLVEIVEGIIARSGQAPIVYADATGVGLPVVDVLRERFKGRYVKIIPVYFTHGDRRSVEDVPEGGGGKQVKLGKAWLVSRLQALLQTTRLHLPATEEARALAKELQDYEIRITENANDTYGAFKVGTHDDLVTALGLAVQDAPVMPQAAISSRSHNILQGPGSPFTARSSRGASRPRRY